VKKVEQRGKTSPREKNIQRIKHANLRKLKVKMPEERHMIKKKRNS